MPAENQPKFLLVPFTFLAWKKNEIKQSANCQRKKILSSKPFANMLSEDFSFKFSWMTACPPKRSSGT